jgi:hypothetical protein
MPPAALTPEVSCDGCGLPATAEHIWARLARLEWSTRFRPIHINLLLLISAPPLEADFYDASPEDFPGRLPGGRTLDALFSALGIVASGANPTGAGGREALLGEFQRRGIFLAPVCECPLATPEIPGAIERLGPTIAKRIRFSYKPKAIVILSPELSGLKEELAAAGQGIHVQDAGNALALAVKGDADASAQLRAVFTGALQP